MAPPVTAETVARLLALVGALERRNDLLQQKNALLRARVSELERRLGLDSSNSGKPPSSDGPGGPARRTRSLRETGVRAPGGQPGHPGRTLKRVAQADHVVAHRPAVCAGRRQVFDLPEPAPLRITEHRVYRCVWPGRGTVTAGAFPAYIARRSSMARD